MGSRQWSVSARMRLHLSFALIPSHFAQNSTMSRAIDSCRSYPYRAPAWLPGGHAQTIWGAALARPKVVYRRERWELPDGDFIDLDWVDAAAGTPLLVLFHGLEGDSNSHYARFLMAAARDRGWRGVVVHFRGCSGVPNRLPRAYNAGDSREMDHVLRRLRQTEVGVPLYVAAVSLGGNVLLKWLGEEGERAIPVIDGAVAISAPLDLPASGAMLDRGFNRLYVARFLRTLKRKALAKLERFPGIYDGASVAAVRRIRTFDDIVTALLHGFRDAEAYWRLSASKPYLKFICLPTLVINARNDPFMPGDVLPGREDVSDLVSLEFPEEGGHVGFVSGPFPGVYRWLPDRVLGFFDALPAAPLQSEQVKAGN